MPTVAIASMVGDAATEHNAPCMISVEKNLKKSRVDYPCIHSGHEHPLKSFVEEIRKLHSSQVFIGECENLYLWKRHLRSI